MDLRTEKPTRYIALTSVSVSQGGLPFYKAKKGKEFNLPKGNYLINGEIKEIPFTYKKIELDLDGRIEISPAKPFTIEFVDNYPPKCSVWLDSGRVVMASIFKELPSFIPMFILLHEKGHYMFRGDGARSEEQCDQYARMKMLELGYNPSQIDLAAQVSLSSNCEASRNRKKLSKENLKK